MFYPYLISYFGSVALHAYVTAYHSNMDYKVTGACYAVTPILLAFPYAINASIESPYVDKTKYHCWMCWDHARFSPWDLVAFAFHIFFSSISVIERLYTNDFSLFTLIYVVIRIVACCLAIFVHDFISFYKEESEGGAKKTEPLKKKSELVAV